MDGKIWAWRMTLVHCSQQVPTHEVGREVLLC